MSRELVIPANSFISITEIQLPPEHIKDFFIQASPIFLGAKATDTPGLLEKRYQFNRETGTFRTITVWQSRESMEGFRDSGKHANEMNEVSKYNAATRFTNYIGDNFPDWDEALQRLDDDPRNIPTEEI